MSQRAAAVEARVRMLPSFHYLNLAAWVSCTLLYVAVEHLDPWARPCHRDYISMGQIGDFMPAQETPAPERHGQQPDVSIPNVDDVTDGLSATWSYLERHQPSRRVILKTAIVAMGALVLDSVRGLPLLKTRPAYAAKYVYWSTCQGFYESSTICTPSSWYYGSDNRGYPVSGKPAYWHREGYSYSRTYTHYPSTCAGNNAWIWAKNYRSTYNVMCSDGYVKSNTGWSSSSICKSSWS